MAREIEVDEQMLEAFITTLSAFQGRMAEMIMAVQSSYVVLNDSYKGSTAAQFKREIESTITEGNSATNCGEEALDWLRRFHRIVLDFERRS